MNDQQFRTWLADAAAAPAPEDLRLRVAAITTAPPVAMRRAGMSWRRPLAIGLVAAALVGAALAAGTIIERPPALPGNGLIVVATGADPVVADPNRGVAIGRNEPMLGGESVASGALQGALRASWSPDGQSIAYSTDRSVTILDVATGERRPIIRNRPCLQSCATAWSPDGTTLAVGIGDLELYDVATGVLQSVIDTKGTPDSVSWSPDGATIAYAVRPVLYTVRPDGSELTQIHSEGEVDGSPERSGPAGGGLERIGPIDVAWSPDGRRIGFLSSDRFMTTTDGWQLKVVVIDPDGSNRRELADAGTCFCLGGGPPGFTWSPDGTQIAFVTLGYIPPHRARDLTSPNGGGGGLYVAGIDGAEPRMLAADFDGTPTWQPVP